MQSPKPDTQDLTARASSLQKRLAEIAAEPRSFTHGLQDIGRGLQTLLENLPADTPDPDKTSTPTPDSPRTDIMRAHLLALIHGLESVADYLTHTERTEQAAADHAPAGQPQKNQTSLPGLQQFISAFQNEAQKRLAGLSISMMGIFNEQNNAPAIEQSAGHLHAVRGGAAMLGLNDIAELAAAMEQLIITIGRIAPEERIWPTQTLMQGYALLRDAADKDDVQIDAPSAQTTISTLRQTIAELATTTPQPDTISAPTGILKRAPIPDEPTPESTSESNSEDTQPDFKNVEQRILIVDDIDTIAATVGFVLADLDVAMDVAHDGQIALKMLREQPYSLIISDVAMPNMNGLELTRAVREDDLLKHLPLILLTSLSQPEERQAGIDAGATDYIIKGEIGGGALLNRVEELLKIAPFVASRSDIQPWKILVAEDTETVAASIAFVLSEGPYDITLAHDGKDALRHLENQDYDLLITDVQMPRMNGLELTQAVRSQKSLQHMPIIMLTSLDADDDRERGLAAGVDSYLVKGEIAGGKLLTLMDSLLASRRDI